MTNPFPSSSSNPGRRRRGSGWAVLGFCLGSAALPGDLVGQIVLSGPHELNFVLPDNDPSGVVDVRTLAAPGYVSEVSIDVSFGGPGSRNGDVYLSLSHESGFVVLLNRVGRDQDRSGGYADPGMTVTFSATGEDIHTYRTSLLGNESTALGERLTGTWSPSGRDADPSTVATGTSRSARLDSFVGLPAAGDWILYAADLGTGGIVTFQSWSLTVTTTASPVPEPSFWATAAALSAVAGIGWIRRRQGRNSASRLP